jgi:hypothetical protein
MKPRTRPSKVSVTQKAINEAGAFGALQQHLPGILAAGEFWECHASIDGLPEDWDYRGIVTVYVGTERADWKIYLEKVDGIRMGFAESMDAQTLSLLMLMPTDHMNSRQALAEACKRI